MVHTGPTRPLEAASERAGPKADYEKTLWRPALSGMLPYRAPLTRRGRPTSRSTRLRALSNGSRTASPSWRDPCARTTTASSEVTGLDLASRAGVDRAAAAACRGCLMSRMA